MPRRVPASEVEPGQFSGTFPFTWVDVAVAVGALALVAAVGVALHLLVRSGARPGVRGNGVGVWAGRLLGGDAWPLVQLGADAAMLTVAVAAAMLGATHAGVPASGPVLWVFVPLTLTVIAFAGGYRAGLQPERFRIAWIAAGATSVGAMSVIVLDAFASASFGFPSLAGRTWGFGALFVAASRLALATARRSAFANGVAGTPALIVGAGAIGAQVERRLREAPDLGLRPCGYLHHGPPLAEAEDRRQAPVLGDVADLERAVAETGAAHVVIAFPGVPDDRLVPLIRRAEGLGLVVTVVPRLFENLTNRAEMKHIGGLPLLRLLATDPDGPEFAVKHAIDRVVAGCAILVTSPMLLAIAIAVKLSSPGGVLFRQERVGKGGKTFEMLKFRTMTGSPEEHGEANEAWAAAMLGSVGPANTTAPMRVTRLGALLRRHSLDELPQLVNVLLGHMSLVGPRPELPQHVARFEGRLRRYAERHRVKPGLTGWAQVNGLRGNTSLQDRVEWDNFYIDNWSLALDLKVVLMTVGALRAPE